MTSTPSARAGTCSACDQSLVQVTEEGVVVDTYHPHNVDTNMCPVLIPIEGTEHLSSHVPAENFQRLTS